MKDGIYTILDKNDPMGASGATEPAWTLMASFIPTATGTIQYAVIGQTQNFIQAILQIIR